MYVFIFLFKEVKEGNGQGNSQSEKNSRSKNRGGKNQINNQAFTSYTMKSHRKPNEQLFYQ